MSIEYRKGDLFSTDIDTIGHSVNVKAVIGGGVSGGFVRLFPEMIKEYKWRCNNGLLKPGGVFIYKSPNGKTVVNLAGQEWPGPDAELEWIEESLTAAFQSGKFTTIALPKIGAGIGGLNWCDVEKILEKVSNTFNIKVVVYEL